jgi:hypothetical protein
MLCVVTVAGCVYAGVGVKHVRAQNDEYIVSFVAGSTIPVPTPNSVFRRSTATDHDDAPFDPITLPWTFPFFGGTRTMTYVDPNGMYGVPKAVDLLLVLTLRPTHNH